MSILVTGKTENKELTKLTTLNSLGITLLGRQGGS